MFIPDTPPEVPPVDISVMLVEAGLADEKHRAIGMCAIVENPAEPYSGSFNILPPVLDVVTYFAWFENKELPEDGKVTLLHGPNRGALEVKGHNSWEYLPNDKNYRGTDSARFLVETGGYKVELTYGISVVDFVGSGDQSAGMHLDPELCPKGEFWRFAPDGGFTPLYHTEVYEEVNFELYEEERVILASGRAALVVTDLPDATHQGRPVMIAQVDPGENAIGLPRVC